MVSIFANLRHEGDLFLKERKELTGIDLQIPVRVLKEKISTFVNLPSHVLDIIFLGQSLPNDSTLSACGIKPQMTITVLKSRTDQEDQETSSSVKDATLQHVNLELKLALTNPNLAKFVGILKRPETYRALLQNVPSLSEEPALIALLKDISMLSLIVNPPDLKLATERYPLLIPALAALLEHFKNSSNTDSPQPTQVSYSVDSLSDDEMEGEMLPGPITSAHLADALANAVAQASGNAQAGTGNSVPTTSGASDMITPEMWNQAMQNALGGSGNPTSANAPTTLQAQLAQLRDMGIYDEGISIQALEATGGDVAAAVELIFTMDQQDSANDS